jgi:hypothetical protein
MSIVIKATSRDPRGCRIVVLSLSPHQAARQRAGADRIILARPPDPVSLVLGIAAPAV